MLSEGLRGQNAMEEGWALCQELWMGQREEHVDNNDPLKLSCTSSPLMKRSIHTGALSHQWFTWKMLRTIFFWCDFSFY